VLDAEEMGRNKDRSDFDQGQIVMAMQMGQNISEMARCGLLPDSSDENLLTVVWGGMNHKLDTGCWVHKAHWYARPKWGYPVWFRPKEDLLWDNVIQNFNDGYGRIVSQYTVHYTPLCSHRTLRNWCWQKLVLQALELNQWKNIAWSDESLLSLWDAAVTPPKTLIVFIHCFILPCLSSWSLIWFCDCVQVCAFHNLP